MKLHEIIQEMTVYGQQKPEADANLPKALARVKQLLGRTFHMRVDTFVKAKEALTQGNINLANQLIEKFKREMNITIVIADAEPGALQAVYGGDKNAVHHDITLLARQWFQVLNSLKQNPTQNAPTVDKWRDPNVAGYAPARRTETATRVEQALVEMCIITA